MRLEYILGPYGSLIPRLEGEEMEWVATPFSISVPKRREKRGPKAIGLMGGTFDPIHYGHLVAAEAARTWLNLDQVLFLPSGRPPHKSIHAISPAQDRLAMTWLATLSNPNFRVSAVETERAGYSYTVDTMLYFRELLGEEDKLFFITGADAILEILTWKRVEELVTLCRFVAVTRPGFPLPLLEAKLRELPDYCQERIIAMDIPALAISSTDIRQRVQQGRSIKYLLPEGVENYILAKGLFLPTQI